MNDKTDYDQKVADIVSDYIKLFQKTKDLAQAQSMKGQNEKKAFQTDLDTLLAKEKTPFRTTQAIQGSDKWKI
jgi:uncharacterized protein (DUF2461 family)